MSILSNIVPGIARRFPKEFNACVTTVRFYGADPPIIRIDHCPGREQIGFGIDSEKQYFDRVDFPCPAVRYKRETPEIKALREKEKGPWKNLTIDEKKALYRASFRLTYAEMEAPEGRWKSYFGWAMLWQACALWLGMAFYYARNRGMVRASLQEDARQAQLQRLIAMKYEVVHGLSSHWDYEKEEWKDDWFIAF